MFRILLIFTESVNDRRFSTNSVSSASPFNVRKNSRSPPPYASPIVTNRKKITSTVERKTHPPSSRKVNSSRNSDWKVEVAVSDASPLTVVSEDKFMRCKENNARAKFEAKRPLFENNSEGKVTSSGGGLKSGSRMLPLESRNSEVITEVDSTVDEHKDGDLSLIRRQLLQIENQQSSLLDLLQRFMGSSQKGIHSLENRVHGLEMVLDEISHDLAVSSGRLSDPAVKTCCSLPGAEFLSPKFWRRTDGGRYSLSGNPTITGMRLLAEQQSGEYPKQRVGLQKSFVVNPLAEVNPQPRGIAEITPNKTLKNGIRDTRDG
ncbi:uncharacterized protein A4U43_C08F7530 [Asparagus officinalis]|nr:uncharacterized protein A4U43_C08F7530 [Asparagus officinalis]